MGVIMDVGTVSEQATRISRASRAVDSSFAMSEDSPFWSVSNSHRFGALSRYFPDGIQCIHDRNMLG